MKGPGMRRAYTACSRPHNRRHVRCEYHHATFRRDGFGAPGAHVLVRAQTLVRGGAWKSALCSFDEDSKPALRPPLDSDGIPGMPFGAPGGHAPPVHIHQHRLQFIDVAKMLDTLEAAL